MMRETRGDDGFPTKQVVVLALCRFSEPIAFVSIFAYSYAMVIDLHGGDDTNASFYSGLLITGFAAAEVCTAFLWSIASDKYGRKPVVLFGLAGVALSNTMFGFAKVYWVAFVARVLGGLLNGNVAVMQTMVSEMVKKPEHEPRAYAVNPFCWTFGSIIGSAMGGLLAEPARYYPSVFATDGLFGEYPYLLPNLVAAGVVVLAIIQGIFLLEETNPRDKRNAQPNPPLVDERTSLLGNGRDHTVDTDADSIRALVVTDTMPAVDLLRADCILSHGAIVQTVEDDAAGGEEHENSKPLKMFNSNVIALSIALVLMSYHQMGFATIFPVYLLDSPSSSFSFMDLQGGLGLTVHDSGIYMAIDGMIAMFFQLVVLPPFIARIGVYRCVVSLTVLYCFPHVVMPFVSLLPDTLLSVGILTGLGLQAFCAVCMFPCLLIMLKNSLSDPKMLARVNGVALSGCCAARTLSPPLVGLIYSYLGSAAAWWSGTIVAGVAVLELYWIPNAETRPADEENGSTREMEQNT